MTSAPGANLFRMQEGGLLIVILILGSLLSLFGGTVQHAQFTTNAAGEVERVMVEKNKFFNARNLAQLAKDTSFVAVMAIGMTFVIISGGIDLSIAAICALASVVAAMVFHGFGPEGARAGASPWMNVPFGIAVCLAVSTACGLANGAMIVFLKVHPFIITLGTMTIFRGIAFVLTDGQSIGRFPEEFTRLVKWEVGDGLSMVPFLVTVLMTLIGGIYLARTTFGRRIYAVGGNELASRYSGVKVERVKLSVFIVSGLMAGVAALLAIGYYGAGSSGDHSGKELNVIAAAVIGGASLTGGKGSALGALLGALIIQMIDSGIVTLGISQNYSQIIIGTVVILAVAFDRLNNWLSGRRLISRA